MTALLERPVLEAPGYRAAALGDGTGFTWSCREHVDDPTGEFTKRECGHGGDDRAAYEEHFKAHGRKALKSAYERWKPWKAPRAAAREPKPAGPGTRVTWVKRTDGHWEGRVYADGPGGFGKTLTGRGTWIDGTVEVREGTVWSAGPVASELWACPDDDPQRPVLVKRHGRKFSFDYRDGDLYEVVGHGDAARLAVLRGEEVRRRGIFPVLDLVVSGSMWGHGEKDRRYVKWHTDRACLKAQGKDPYDLEAHGHASGYSRLGLYGEGPWLPLDVAAVLARGGQVPSELCDVCVTSLPVGGE